MKNFLILIAIVIVMILIGCTEKREGLPEGKVEIVKTEIPTQDEKEYGKAAEFKIEERKTHSGFFTNEGEVGKEYFVEDIFYDDNGFKIKQTRYLSNGGIDIEWIYNYDSDGNLVFMESKDGFGRLMHKRSSVYDKWGNELERTEFDIQLKGEFKTIFMYDTQGYLLEERTFNKDEILNGRTEYGYSGNFLGIKKIYDKQNKLTSEIKYFYDGNDNKVMEVTYSPPNFRDTVRYAYDKESQLLAVNSKSFAQQFNYGEDGNVVEERYFNQLDALQQYITYEYDSKGLLINKIKHDGMETPVLNIRYSYEYY